MFSPTVLLDRLGLTSVAVNVIPNLPEGKVIGVNFSAEIFGKLARNVLELHVEFKGGGVRQYVLSQMFEDNNSWTLNEERTIRQPLRPLSEIHNEQEA